MEIDLNYFSCRRLVVQYHYKLAYGSADIPSSLTLGFVAIFYQRISLYRWFSIYSLLCV